MLEAFVSILGIIMSAITTILVAIIGSHQAKKSKETEEYRKLQAENEQMRRAAEERQRKEDADRMKKIEISVKKLTTEVDDLKKSYDITRLENQLKQLHTLNSANFEYMQRVSQTVLIIGESLSDNISIEDKAKVESELKDHKTKEVAIMQQLYNVIA